MTGTDPERVLEARAIIDGNLYMVLATSDLSGRPWASPVYYAAAGYGEFFWVSSHEARHSRNIERRPHVGIVVFDSRVPIGTGQGVYMEAEAQELIGADLDRGLTVFSARSVEHGGTAWTREDVPPDGLLRMFRARAVSHSMLAKDGQPDHRVAIDTP